MTNVLFIGPAPQNIGGISMHVRRLVGLLNADIIPDFVDEGHSRFDGVFNLRSLNLCVYIRKIVGADVVHIHSGVWILRAFHIIVCKLLFRKKVVVTVHRDPTIEPHYKLTRGLLKRCDHAILVNQKGYDSMIRQSKCKYHMLPAFLPPIIENEPLLPKTLAEWIADVRKNSKGILLCSNAWNLVLYNGQDLYGLDLCIDAMIRLKNEERNYYLVFVVASNTNQQARLKEYKQTIADNNLEHNVIILEYSISFVRLIQESDAVLRTTNTDGDAISIREALFLKKNVIASDVVVRPEGTILFKTGDVDDLVEKIRNVDIRANVFERTISCDYRELYLSMYK